MMKKLMILSTVVLLYGMPTQAQSLRIALDYHSFQPFIHFQLNFENHRYHRSYRQAYLKGYMDGVNEHRYYNHRFAEMVENQRIYEAGYRDGFEDRGLLIRLRGRDWLQRHRFTYNDYYAPTSSVRIWLEGLSMAFLRAPERRLPRHWKRRVHPRVKKYRGWMKWRHHRDDDYERDDDEWEDDEYEYDYEDYDEYDDDFEDLERIYRKRIKRYEHRARKTRKRHFKKASYRSRDRSRGKHIRKRHPRKHQRGKGRGRGHRGRDRD